MNATFHRDTRDEAAGGNLLGEATREYRYRAVHGYLMIRLEELAWTNPDQAGSGGISQVGMTKINAGFSVYHSFFGVDHGLFSRYRHSIHAWSPCR